VRCGGGIDLCFDRSGARRTCASAHDAQPAALRSPSAHGAHTGVAFYGVWSVDNDVSAGGAVVLAEEVASLWALTGRWQAENVRLLRLLELAPKQAATPGPCRRVF
jgi:hypothetical protein